VCVACVGYCENMLNMLNILNYFYFVVDYLRSIADITVIAIMLIKELIMFYCENGYCSVEVDSHDGDFVSVDGVDYVVDFDHLGYAYITKDGQSYILTK